MITVSGDRPRAITAQVIEVNHAEVLLQMKIYSDVAQRSAAPADISNEGSRSLRSPIRASGASRVVPAPSLAIKPDSTGKTTPPRK